MTTTPFELKTDEHGLEEEQAGGNVGIVQEGGNLSAELNKKWNRK